MKPLTDSEQALVAYFYKVSGDPRIKAAGLNPSKFASAFLTRIEEDIVRVTAYVLHGGIGMASPKVTRAAQNVTATILGGTVPQHTQQAMATEVGELVKDGFKWFGELLERKVAEHEKSKANRK